jgi:hypothetical protein
MKFPDNPEFQIGERVAWVDCLNGLRFGTISEADPLELGRVCIRDANGFIARPTSDRVSRVGAGLLDALELAEATIVRLDRKGSAVGTLDVIRSVISSVKRN